MKLAKLRNAYCLSGVMGISELMAQHSYSVSPACCLWACKVSILILVIRWCNPLADKLSARDYSFLSYIMTTFDEDSDCIHKMAFEPEYFL